MEAIISMTFDEFIHFPLIEFTNNIPERFNAMKFITGSKFNDRKILVHTLGGDWFTVQAQKIIIQQGSFRHGRVQKLWGENADVNNFFELKFWDYKSTLFLGCLAFPIGNILKPISNEVANQVKEMMDLYHDGNVLCSDCFLVIEATKAGGTHFAGIYCPGCWKGETGIHKGKGGWEAEKKKARVN